MDFATILVGTLTALLSSTGFLLALFVGFCFLAGLAKFRNIRERDAMVVRSLSEAVDGRVTYLAHDAPYGKTDQLKTPELLEQSGRHT